jgi:hypothetical protein
MSRASRGEGPLEREKRDRAPDALPLPLVPRIRNRAASSPKRSRARFIPAPGRAETSCSSERARPGTPPRPRGEEEGAAAGLAYRASSTNVAESFLACATRVGVPDVAGGTARMPTPSGRATALSVFEGGTCTAVTRLVAVPSVDPRWGAAAPTGTVNAHRSGSAPQLDITAVLVRGQGGGGPLERRAAGARHDEGDDDARDCEAVPDEDRVVVSAHIAE